MRRLLACVALTAAVISSAQADVINLGRVDLRGAGTTTETGSLSAQLGPTLNWASARQDGLRVNPTGPQNAVSERIAIENIPLSLTSNPGNALQSSNAAAPLVLSQPAPGLGNAGSLLGSGSEQQLSLPPFLAGGGNGSEARPGVSAAPPSVAGGAETFSAVIPVPLGPLSPVVTLFLSTLVGLGFWWRRRERAVRAV